MDDTARQPLAEEILLYLAKHPDASDSAEGIADWWLARQRYEESVTRVQDALNELEAKGLVVRAVLPDGTVIYRASPEFRASHALQ
jgi:Fe2+ or Zn2+ uptake regulation protein